MPTQSRLVTSPFPRLLSELQRLNPGLQGLGSPNWGAQNPDSRSSIRRSLTENLPRLGSEDLRVISDLSEPPRPEQWAVSIAHTHDFGGWMAAPRPLQIGWDIEQKDRIRRPIIERVCSSDEITRAPFVSALWCAKEAFFKALEDEQPLTVSQLTIEAWQQLGAGSWRWEGLGPRNAAGFLVEEGHWLAAGSVVL